MTPPLPPDKDIGPFYKFLGACSLFAGIGLMFFHAMHERDVTWADALIFFILIMTSLALIRPDKFDNVVKSVADWLPFVRYKKED